MKILAALLMVLGVLLLVILPSIIIMILINWKNDPD